MIFSTYTKKGKKMEFFHSRRQTLVSGLKLLTGYSLLNACGFLFESWFPNCRTFHGGQALGAPMEGPTLVHFVLIDKIQPALFEAIPGTIPQGSDGQGGAAQKKSDFRNMGLSKLFGDTLLGLPDSVSLSVLHAWESGNGGHSLQNSTISRDLGGVNAAFEKLSASKSLLGPVGFGFASDANNAADAFLGAGGNAMKTFSDVKSLSDTLTNSAAPIIAGKNSDSLVRSFDALASKDVKFRDTLVQLANNVLGAASDLQTAAAVADPISQQVASVIALSKAGVCRNFMIAIPYDDTNGGGSLTTAGGRFNLDPFSVTPLIGKALVDLHKAIPNLVCVSTSDGGRDVGNGDRSPGIAFMTGPATALKNGIVGAPYTSTDQLGQNFTTTKLSSGQDQVARPAQWYGTALRSMGLDAGVDYIPEALVSG